jgi:hypothetical protein
VKVLAATLLVAAVAPAPEIRYFRLQRPINVPQNATGQACVVLDPQIFRRAASGLADLRLYRGVDETPYVIHSGWQSQPAQPAILPVNRGERAAKTVFDAAMPDGEYSDVLLNLTGQNFLDTVTVTGSQSVRGPQTRIGTYTIFDFSSQHLGRSTVLHLPRSNFRFLHFEISGPIKPDQLVSLAATAAPPIEPKYLTILTAGQFAREGKTSVARFDLPPNVPVDRIVFSPAALPVNFSRDVEVQGTDIKPEGDSAPVPSTAASASLLRIHRVQDNRRIDEEQLALATPGPAFQFRTHWTITIENGDDVPIGFSKVQVQMRERSLCFEVTPGAPYALYYGDGILSAPRYDYAAWFAPQANALVATLGAEQANAAFHERRDTRPFTEKHPALLWIALVGVVLLLGFVALRTAQRTPTISP